MDKKKKFETEIDQSSAHIVQKKIKLKQTKVFESEEERLKCHQETNLVHKVKILEEQIEEFKSEIESLRKIVSN